MGLGLSASAALLPHIAVDGVHVVLHRGCNLRHRTRGIQGNDERLGAVASLVVLVDDALHQLALRVGIHTLLHQSGTAVIAIGHLIDDVLLGVVVNDTADQLAILTLGVVIYCCQATAGGVRGSAHAAPALLALVNGAGAIRVAHHTHHITGFIHDFGTLRLHSRQHRHHSRGNRQHPSVNHSVHAPILPIHPLIGKRK